MDKHGDKIRKLRSGAWTRQEGQDPEGGLNAAGRASYNRENNANLKPPVKASDPSEANQARRKSFCARSAGQAEMFPKAAKDPDSRLNKARRAWDC
jgi:hypothetical protein